MHDAVKSLRPNIEPILFCGGILLHFSPDKEAVDWIKNENLSNNIRKE